MKVLFRPRLLALIALALLSMPTAPAHAARPFVTDDARIVDPGGCQIETFTRRQQRESENEFWFLPGCSPRALGNMELTFGGLRTDNGTLGTEDTLIGQLKTLVRPLETDGWGVAATLGGMRQAMVPGSRKSWNPYLNLIASLSFAQDRVVVHTNLGALRDRLATQTLYTWGLGAEVLLAGSLSGIAEVYNQQREKPSTQVGLRYWISPNRLQVDTTLGTQGASDGRHTWASLGLRILW